MELDGTISTERVTVLDKWKTDFKNLLTPPAKDDQEKSDFKNEIRYKIETEENMFAYGVAPKLNCEFDVDEVEKIISKAESGKVPGIDGLLAVTMKNPISFRILTPLFNTCLRRRMSPSV